MKSIRKMLLTTVAMVGMVGMLTGAAYADSAYYSSDTMWLMDLNTGTGTNTGLGAASVPIEITESGSAAGGVIESEEVGTGTMRAPGGEVDTGTVEPMQSPDTMQSPQMMEPGTGAGGETMGVGGAAGAGAGGVIMTDPNVERAIDREREIDSGVLGRGTGTRGSATGGTVEQPGYEPQRGVIEREGASGTGAGGTVEPYGAAPQSDPSLDPAWQRDPSLQKGVIEREGTYGTGAGGTVGSDPNVIDRGATGTMGTGGEQQMGTGTGEGTMGTTGGGSMGTGTGGTTDTGTGGSGGAGGSGW